MKSTIEEFTLISRIVLWGDQRAFEKLLNHYQHPVRRLFTILTRGDEFLSDDLTQDTFIKVWLQIGSFKMLSSFSTWLYKIAYNEYLNHCRRDKSHLRVEVKDDNLVLHESENRNPEEESIFIQQMLQKLSPPECTCITLFYLEEQSIKQIAVITGFAEGTIKSHLSRGRESLRKLIPKDYNYDK